jgi:hypothetical protein
MAVGSNTLGLLFKIGIDPGDSKNQLQALEKELDQLAKTNFETLKKAFSDLRDLGKGVFEGGKQAWKDFWSGAEEGAQRTSEGLKKVTESSKGLNTALNQATSGLRELSSGDIGSGIVNLGKSFVSLGPAIGTVLIGLGAVALAAFAAKKSFDLIIDSSKEIGTRSKDDFDELQKNATAAGTPITELQRNLSQGVVNALDQVKGASAGFMAKVIEVSGPALIQLFKDITKFLVDMQPLAVKIGNLLSEAFIIASASLRVFRDLLKTTEEEQKKKISSEHGLLGDFLFGTTPPGANDPIIAGNKTLFRHIVDEYRQQVAAVRADIASAVVPTAGFDPKKTKQYKQGLDDLAQALADFNKAQRLANEERQAIAVDEAHYIINRDKATDLLIAIEEKLFEAQKKRIEAERDNAQLNAKTQDQRVAAATKAEDAIANARSQADVKISQLREKRDKDDQAADDKLIDRAIELDAKERELTDKRREFELKSNLDTQKAINEAKAIKDPAGFVTLTDTIEAEAQRQAAALDPLTGAWRGLKLAISDAVTSSGPAIIDWVKEVTGVINRLIEALQTTFQTFILTGKLGADAFRTLAAALLTHLAVEAVHQVLKMHAKAVEETAYALQALAFGDYAGFTKHSLAAAQFAHAAIVWGLVGGGAVAAGVAIGATGGLGGGGTKEAAGGGGFGGAGEAPGTVTINQGAGGPLGIQLQQLNALNNISNTLSTASPGDVLTRGAEQNPMVIGQANNEAARRDGTVSREFLQISGLRPA